CLPALADRPDHQRLPASQISRRKDARNAGHVVLIRDNVPARVELQLDLPDRPILLGTEEAQREEAQIAIHLELAAGDFLELRRPTRGVALPFEANAVQLFHDSVLAAERFGVYREIAQIRRDTLLRLFMRRRGAIYHRPVRPRLHALLEIPILRGPG